MRNKSGSNPTLEIYIRSGIIKLEQKIEELIILEIEKLGIELYDIEYTKYNKENYLRIFIDKDLGISIDDCEAVTKEINDILDEIDLIKEPYYLEVSSAGIEKILKKDKHYERNLGKEVEVNLYKKFENKKQYRGLLKSFNVEKLIIIDNEKEIEFFRKDISQVKQIYDWDRRD